MTARMSNLAGILADAVTGIQAPQNPSHTTT